MKAQWMWRVALGIGLFVAVGAFYLMTPSVSYAASCDGAPAPCAEDPTIDNCVQCHSIRITGGNRGTGTDRQITVSASSNRHILGPPMSDWTSTVQGMISKGAPGTVEKTAAYLNSNYCIGCNGPILSSASISNIQSSAATVSWTTSGSGYGDLAATSCVLYGTSTTSLTGNTCTPSDPSYDPNSGNLVTSHQVTITGLTGLTKYYVVHRSVAGGNTATYTLASSFTTPPGGGGGGGGGALGTIVSLAVGDYNNDFNLDLGVGVSTKNHVIGFLGNGSGGFTQGQTLANVGTTPTAITSGGVKGDFNGDGRDDLAVANFGSKDVAVFLGTTPSGFQTTAVSSIPVTDPPTAVATGDFDEDGILDLAVATVVADGSAGHVLIFKGQNDGSGHGTGHFTGPITTLNIEVTTVLSPTITSIVPGTVDCTGLPVDITITGTLLLEGLTVSLDDTLPLTVVSVSADSTSVVARVPNGVAAGTHSVVVTVGGLPPTSGTLVVAPRPVTISIVSPASKTYSIDPSGTVSIQGSGFTLGATATIGTISGATVAGSFASETTPFVFVNSTLIRVWVGNTALPAGTYDVSVVNTDTCGGSATANNAFTMAAPVPTIAGLSPSTVTYGITPSQSVTISGANFISGAVINVGGLSGTTVPGVSASASTPFVYVSSSTLRFYWNNTALPVGPHSVQVTNPTVAGGVTGALVDGFVVTAPQPTVVLVSPTPVTYGVSLSQSVTVSGSQFLLGARVSVGGLTGVTVAGSIATATTPFVYVNSGQLKFWWSNTSLGPGTYDVLVENPVAAGGLSATLPGGFEVDGPQPTVTSVSPTPVTYGITGNSSITIFGDNFVLGATITVGALSGQTVAGNPATAANPYVWVNKNQVKFYWPNTSLPPGAYAVQVTNPPAAGGLGATLAAGFTVAAPQPTLTNLSPDTVTYGISSSISVSVFGSNFIVGSQITIGSLSGTTVTGSLATSTTPYVYVSASQLRFYWPNTSLPPGVYSIQVTNPAVAGGLSATLASAFTVSPPQPTVTLVSPSPVTYAISASSSVTIYGSNFINGGTITVGTLSGTMVAGSNATATTPYVWMNSGQVKFYWPNTSLPVGSYAVTVANPAVAGGLSATLANGFVVSAPQPVVDPATTISLVYGVTSSRAVTVYGSGFVVGANLTLGSLSGNVVAGSIANATTPFVWVNSGRLSVWWPNTSLPVGSYAITVTNPAAAGSLSGSLADVVTITAPTPAISGLSPATVTYGGSSISITISGSNFVLGGTITVGSLSGATVSGTNATSTVRYVWVTNTQVKFYWPSTSLPAGSYDVTYTNPAAAGSATTTLTGGFVVQ